MFLIFCAFILPCAVAVSLPVLPTAFQATVSIQSPIGLPPITGTSYYSLSLGAQRFDTFQFGITDQTFLFRDPAGLYQAKCSSGLCTCRSSYLDAAMFPLYFVPPSAAFLGFEVVNAVPCQHWQWVTNGRPYDAWVAETTDSETGRVHTVPVRFKLYLLHAARSVVDFANVVLAELSPSVFSAVSAGCPPQPVATVFDVEGFVMSALDRVAVTRASVTLQSSSYGFTGGSDATGKFSVADAAPGTYSLAASAKGFYSASKALSVASGIAPGTLADLFLVPQLPMGDGVAVLTWGAGPTTLDLSDMYLNGACTTTWDSRTPCTGVILSPSSGEGFGPATIYYPWLVDSVGVHTVSVTLGSSGDLCASHASVAFYSDSGLVRSLLLSESHCRAAAATVWTVAEFDPFMARVTPLEQYS
jgi:hypothetical protein